MSEERVPNEELKIYLESLKGSLAAHDGLHEKRVRFAVLSVATGDDLLAPFARAGLPLCAAAVAARSFMPQHRAGIRVSCR